ncbi:MAG: hypothetical protein WBM90_04320 [Acidimicrobiia bacterium]
MSISIVRYPRLEVFDDYWFGAGVDAGLIGVVPVLDGYDQQYRTGRGLFGLPGLLPHQ